VATILGEGTGRVRKELKEVSRKMQELQASLPPEYENHGCVWLFLRKPAEAKAGPK
jgi:hypothetical protein